MTPAKPFSLQVLLSKKVVEDLKIVTENLSLDVSGTYKFFPGVSRFDTESPFVIDVDTVLYEGCDIKGVLEFTDRWEDVLTECERHVSGLCYTDAAPLSHDWMMNLFANNLKAV